MLIGFLNLFFLVWSSLFCRPPTLVFAVFFSSFVSSVFNPVLVSTVSYFLIFLFLFQVLFVLCCFLLFYFSVCCSLFCQFCIALFLHSTFSLSKFPFMLWFPMFSTFLFLSCFLLFLICGLYFWPLGNARSSLTFSYPFSFSLFPGISKALVLGEGALGPPFGLRVLCPRS